MSDPIYLDHNATTPVRAEVVEAMLPFLTQHFGNPSSSHIFGQRARHAVDQAREQIAAALGCKPHEILFTSGGTEANNLAIRGVTAALPYRKHVVTTAVEHPATAEPCNYLARNGYRVDRLGVDADGQVDLDELDRLVDTQTALVTILHAHNETGVIQPTLDIAKLAHRHSAVVHADVAQAIGKIAVNVEDLRVDLLSIAGHKLGAPKGVGALYVRTGTPLSPLLLGANHERGLRPGTENVASIVALGLACQLAVGELERNSGRIAGLRDSLWQSLQAGIPGMVCNGEASPRLPNTLSVRFPRVTGHAVLAAAPDIAASTGSACHDGSVTAPAVLLAMGVDASEAAGTVRLSLGRTTSLDDVQQAVGALVRSWRRVIEAGSHGGVDVEVTHVDLLAQR